MSSDWSPVLPISRRVGRYSKPLTPPPPRDTRCLILGSHARSHDTVEMAPGGGTDADRMRCAILEKKSGNETWPCTCCLTDSRHSSTAACFLHHPKPPHPRTSPARSTHPSQHSIMPKGQGHGTNSQGNTYNTPGGTNSSGGQSYHYSNSDGSCEDRS